jgi:hypothetical protein
MALPQPVRLRRSSALSMSRRLDFWNKGRRRPKERNMKISKIVFLLVLFNFEQTGAIAAGLTFVSDPYATFTFGQAGTFRVITQPDDPSTFGPPPALFVLNIFGDPPPGMSFTDNGDFTGTLAGTPLYGGIFHIVLAAYAPGSDPFNGLPLVTQPFAATVTALALTSDCMTTFVANQPFTVYGDVLNSGDVPASGTLNVTQDSVDPTQPNISLCTFAAPSGGCTITSLAAQGTYAQNFTLTMSYAGDGNYRADNSLPLAVTVLNAVDVVSRNGFEANLSGCPTH